MATTNKTLLIFVPTYPVRSETFIQREIEELAQRTQKYKIRVLSLRPGYEDSKSSPGVNVLYKRTSPVDFLEGLFVINWSVLPRLLSEGLKNHPRGLSSNLYLIIKAVGYSAIVHKLGASHIHAHFLSESSTLMYYVSEMLAIPYSISAHARDVFATSKDITAIPEMVKEKAKKAAFIVVCNKKAWESCRELAGREYADKILLHYHGLNPSRLPEPQSLSLADDSAYVVSVGRLVEKKGFSYLVDAAKLLINDGYKCHIKIIGPGPLYKKINEKITANGLGEWVEVLGGGQGMSNDEVLKVMAASKMFVLPSIETAEGDAEGIPNTLVEAAFLKKPIVSTKSGSIAEFIKNQESGILVEPKDPKALANAMKYLLDNEEIAKNYGENAWRAANDSFNLAINVKELDTLFSENLA